MVNEEKFYKISEKLNEICGQLESSFKYQIITIALFVSYLLGDIHEKIKFFDIEFNVRLFILIFPVVLLYLVSRMALLTMLFIEFSELFFAYLNNMSSDEDKKYYRAFRPQTIFVSIVLSRNTMDNDVVRKWFCLILSGIIYVFPGVSMGLSVFSILRYQHTLLGVVLVVLTMIVFGGMFYEYYYGTYTRHYRYILFTTFISMIVFTVGMFIIDSYGLRY